MIYSSNSDGLLVAGIASSAGGLVPLKELISAVICDCLLTIIMAPHILRHQESGLVELMKPISKFTVLNITEGMKVEAWHLYILPSGFYVSVADGFFKLKRRPANGVNLAANILFKSLADCYGQKSIGIVLSGAAVGADAVEGIIAIKKSGGRTYVQDPLTARFPDMPQAAIDTGRINLN